MNCPACRAPQRNLGIGPRPLWHCDVCEAYKITPTYRNSHTPIEDSITLWVSKFGKGAVARGGQATGLDDRLIAKGFVCPLHLPTSRVARLNKRSDGLWWYKILPAEVK
jgi:hypothetical protein